MWLHRYSWDQWHSEWPPSDLRKILPEIKSEMQYLLSDCRSENEMKIWDNTLSAECWRGKYCCGSCSLDINMFLWPPHSQHQSNPENICSKDTVSTSAERSHSGNTHSSQAMLFLLIRAANCPSYRRHTENANKCTLNSPSKTEYSSQISFLRYFGGHKT